MTTFLCGEVMLTPGGLVARQVCRKCGGEVLKQARYGRPICPACCVNFDGRRSHDLPHLRTSESPNVCVLCASDSTDYDYED